MVKLVPVATNPEGAPIETPRPRTIIETGRAPTGAPGAASDGRGRWEGRSDAGGPVECEDRRVGGGGALAARPRPAPCPHPPGRRLRDGGEGADQEDGRRPGGYAVAGRRAGRWDDGQDAPGRPTHNLGGPAPGRRAADTERGLGPPTHDTRVTRPTSIDRPGLEGWERKNGTVHSHPPRLHSDHVQGGCSLEMQVPGHREPSTLSTLTPEDTPLLRPQTCPSPDLLGVGYTGPRWTRTSRDS